MWCLGLNHGRWVRRKSVEKKGGKQEELVYLVDLCFWGVFEWLVYLIPCLVVVAKDLEEKGLGHGEETFGPNCRTS